ncbi:MAG: aminoacyl-tRNA hydrolase [Acidobacteriota bacterium]|nr:aminoacyl-tRNA hydrolase [Acidobacteriota bacterium]
MFLVAGLGNPGEDYAETPHNLGFLVVDRYAREHGIRVNRNHSKALVGFGEINTGEALMLAKPQTFMNLSGTSLKPLMVKHSVSPKELILIYDELDLPWGEVRVRPGGRPHGHNGVRSVIEMLGTEEFTRVRLGAHPGHPLKSGSDYLLAPFSRQQKKELDQVLQLASEAVGSIIADGVEMSMTRFNRRAGGLQPEEK